MFYKFRSIRLKSLRKVKVVRTATPHDGFFQGAMSRPDVYRQYFDRYLPAALRKRIKFESIEPVKGRFLDNRLRWLYTDCLFKAKFLDDAGKEFEGYIYLLVEHFSTLPADAVIRIYRYLFEIWSDLMKSDEFKQKKKLPFIYPMICYTGRRKRKIKRLPEMIQAPEAMVAELFSNPITVSDAVREQDALADKYQYLAVMMLTFKHIHDEDERCEVLFRMLANIDHQLDLGDFLKLVIRYIIEVRKVDIPRLKQFVDEEVEGKIGVLLMATADELREEGRDEGLKKGRDEGETLALSRMIMVLLSEKFEDLPGWVMQKIQNASVENLERWMANILRKNSVEEIFT